MTGRQCKVPGCARTLYAHNRNGVCRDHNHRRPYCQCVQCDPGQAKPSYRPATPEEIRDRNNETRDRARRRPTLPQRPWEKLR